MRTPCLILLALVSTPLLADAPRHHGPNVHGEATLNIVQDGDSLSLWLNAPAMSFLGFEHAPRDAAERKRLDETMAILKRPADWLVPVASGGCSSDTVNVQSEGLNNDKAAPEHEHDDEDNTHDEHEHADGDHHADFDGYYRYRCRAPLSLRTLDVALFERFPSLHKINVNLVLDDRQGSQILVPDAHQVTFSK
jgi:hypothetical protein